MRKLRVVVAMSGAVPVIAAAAFVPVAACGARTDPGDIGDGAIDDARLDGKKDVSATDGPIFVVDAASEDTGVPPSSCPPDQESSFIVQVPPPGVPADPGQICAVNVSPVDSNQAARVTFTKYSQKPEAAIGFIAIPTALLAQIVGPPTVTITQVSDPAMAAMQVSAMAPTPGGFTFQASWPAPFAPDTCGGQIVVKTSFSISCGDGAVQAVESYTVLHLCVDGSSVDWASSGDSCTICCTIIAEMAPSPIIPDAGGDELPLGRVIRLRVRELARAGRTVLLFAENDGGEAAEHQWRASAGELAQVAPDVMLWKLPEDETDPAPAYVQVAVSNESGAAVASYAWDLGVVP